MKKDGRVENARKVGLSNRIEWGVAAFNVLYGNYKKAATVRNLEFSLTKEEFREVTSKSCHYCGVAPSNLAISPNKKKQLFGNYTFNGIDRKNNIEGYTYPNILPCCKTCNYAKRNMTYDDFTTYLIRVVEFLRPKT